MNTADRSVVTAGHAAAVVHLSRAGTADLFLRVVFGAFASLDPVIFGPGVHDAFDVELLSGRAHQGAVRRGVVAFVSGPDRLSGWDGRKDGC